MKWIIWTAIAIPAVLHWGFFGIMVMGTVLAIMLENEPPRNKEEVFEALIDFFIITKFGNSPLLPAFYNIKLVL